MPDKASVATYVDAANGVLSASTGVGLTGEPATGRVRIDSAPFSGEIPRVDLAALLAAVLGSTRAGRRILYVNGGDEPIDKALALALTMTS